MGGTVFRPTLSVIPPTEIRGEIIIYRGKSDFYRSIVTIIKWVRDHMSALFADVVIRAPARFVDLLRVDDEI